MNFNFKTQLKDFSSEKGFTLVEVLVSVTLFTVVAVVGITSVLVAKSAYEKNRAIKSTSDSLAFIMEDISRTARLGSLYRCIPSVSQGSVDIGDIEIPQDNQNGSSCRGFAYEPFWNMIAGDPGDQIIYVFAQDSSGVGALFTRSMADQTSSGTIQINDSYFQRISPKGLDIDLDRSGFDVVGSENPAVQPRVIIRIHGTISEKDQTTELALQTTISQRAINIE